jgi:NAD(P)-dependent dehydrogenase (short-subunit alcohol dehydrogenase family)
VKLKEHYMISWNTEKIGNLQGIDVIVTGGSSGIGFEAAKVLAAKGASVTLAVRNVEKGKRVTEKVHTSNLDAVMTVMHLDLADLKSIKDFADRYQSNKDHLHILINNAGVMIPPYRKTKDGFESQFGTNHLGHFALTVHLLPLLLATPHSRVVSTSSLAARKGKIYFDNLDGSRGYNPMRFYRQSKLANLLFAIELQHRLGRAGTSTISVACHPGISVSNLLSRGSGKEANHFLKKMMRIVAQPARQGALPTLYAASNPDLKGGEYIGPDGPGNRKGNPVQTTEASRLFNKEIAARLWELSEDLTGVRFPF